MRYGLIAGNGRFPLLALESAARLGLDVTVIAIEEEASPEVASMAPRCHWISLGQLSKLIEILKSEDITEVVMCGQVKHAKIFSSIVPDWRLVKLLASLPSRNTDGLIGGVVKVLEGEGIHLRDSTWLLKPLLAGAGGRTWNTAAAWPTRWRVSMSDRRWRFPSAPAWLSKPWKAPMPCCDAPPDWSTAGAWRWSR